MLAGSPAVDAGTLLGAPASDQRGVARPQGAGVDIGAYELRPLVLTALTRIGPNLAISFATEFGPKYRVERTDSLAPANWTTVADNVPGTGSIVQVTDPGGATQPQRFYRGRTLP